MGAQSGLSRAKSFGSIGGDSWVYDVYFERFDRKLGKYILDWVGAVTVDSNVTDPTVKLMKVVGNPPKGQTMKFSRRPRC